MKTTRYLGAVSIFLMPLALAACMETGKYNEYAGKANKAISEQIKQDEDAGQKGKALNESLKDFPENRDALKSQADEVIALFDKSVTSLKTAAESWEAASKLNIDDKLKDYASAQAQYCRKEAEANEYGKKTFQLVNDPSITSLEELQTARESITEQLKTLLKEGEDYLQKATKIANDNPTLFKKL